jgi:hypothetical protein
MSPTSYQAAPLRDNLKHMDSLRKDESLPETGIEPVREFNPAGF